jgi:hypothetical protein
MCARKSYGMYPLEPATSKVGSTRSAVDRLVVRHDGEWVVEVMKNLLPLLILRRLPKADLVVVEGLPPDEKNVFVASFDASLKLVRDVAWHRRNELLGLAKRSFELGRLTGANVERRNFEDHDERAG